MCFLRGFWAPFSDSAVLAGNCEWRRVLRGRPPGYLIPLIGYRPILLALSLGYLAAVLVIRLRSETSGWHGKRTPEA